MPVEIVFQQHNEGITPNCLLCEEMVKIAEKRINKKTTKVRISFFCLFVFCNYVIVFKQFTNVVMSEVIYEGVSLI